VDISFDSAKDERNLAARGISFELAAEFDWNSALIVEDLRRLMANNDFKHWGGLAIAYTCWCLLLAHGRFMCARQTNVR
jgi:uncharacterized DUF497 family protein